MFQDHMFKNNELCCINSEFDTNLNSISGMIMDFDTNPLDPNIFWRESFLIKVFKT